MKPKSTPDPASLRERALAYLARREHSRFELTRKLEAVGYSASDIHPVLDELETKNWLSDRRFAESWVADHRSKDGNLKLRFDLRQRGVDDDTITEAVERNTDDTSERQRATALWTRKFGTPPADGAEKARQIRYLESRGFSSETVRTTMKQLIQPD